ncbi:MAG TPA: 3'(2'),5'-bisphosphate nucleotidase CysQ [Bacteroidales bacterium]|nr:3'(2'),5'-bisphosphate nucleotidase CysQ [Bacteroidales bacterium]
MDYATIYSKVKPVLEMASKAVLGVYSSGDPETKSKNDGSPVTRADYASNIIITGELEKLFPDIPIITEESPLLNYESRKNYDLVWILDPLDGTKEFLNRTGEFCISLALISHNRPVAGFILAPTTNELWYAVKGKGAYCEINNSTARLPLVKPGRKLLITRSRSHHNETEKIWIDKLAEKYPSEIIIQGSAIKFCRLAGGNASVYPKFGSINEWDVAAGDIILSEAGGIILETESGERPLYNKESLKQPHFVAWAAGTEEFRA